MVVDDTTVSLGPGRHARGYLRNALLPPETLAWGLLARIPTLTVTALTARPPARGWWRQWCVRRATASG
jgi:hypothetical protein